MLSALWLVPAVVAAILLSMWVTFTLTRLDRLHARVDAARAALDAQLVRRAAALLQIAESPDGALPGELRGRYEQTARAALSPAPLSPAQLSRAQPNPAQPNPAQPTPAQPHRREAVENAVGRAVVELSTAHVGQAAAAELREAAARVEVARRFYNDAVRDTRTLRARRMPRLLHLAGRVELPQFFDIDDSLPPEPPADAHTEPPPEKASETS